MQNRSRQLLIDEDMYICPISRCPILHPVIASDERIYELRELYNFVKAGGKLSPLTRAPLTSATYSVSLKNAFDQLLKEDSERYDANQYINQENSGQDISKEGCLRYLATQLSLAKPVVISPLPTHTPTIGVNPLNPARSLILCTYASALFLTYEYGSSYFKESDGNTRIDHLFILNLIIFTTDTIVGLMTGQEHGCLSLLYKTGSDCLGFFRRRTVTEDSSLTPYAQLTSGIQP